MTGSENGCVEMTRCWTLRIAALTVALVTVAGHTAAARQGSAIETAVFARAIQPGVVVRLDVTCACGPATATARVFDHDVPLFPLAGSSSWRGLVGIDVDVVPGKYPIVVTIDRPGQPVLTTTRELVVVGKRFPTRRLTVAAKFVDPPAGEVERIQSEARRLQTLFEAATPRLLWQGMIQLPVTAEPSGSFGMRSIFNGQARSPHGGTDFPSPTGAPVAAPAGGSIVLAEELYFTGNTIVIDHGLGLYSLLAHLSRLDVKSGEMVTQGQIVGLVGATGRVTGPHLHWATRLGGARIDPLSLIATATTRD
jgi:murein DD-endopeptidase MepM/ murein hydrolase activator NlpD